MNNNSKWKIVNKVLIIQLLILCAFFMNLHAFNKVKAQTLCDFGPCINEDDIGEGDDLEENVNSTIENTVRLGVSLVFVGIIALGFFYVIKAAVKIIRGEGDSGEIEKGLTSIKSVYIGVALIFAGILGIVIVTGVFGAGSVFSLEINEPEGINLPFID